MDLMAFEPEVLRLAAALRQRGWRLTTAESCTGGLIAAACTMVAGSSDWFERGFVTYSNAAKSEMLGVDAASITTHGAVSETVVRAMALGARIRARADIGVAVTGVAGPGGGSASKPVGLVWLAVACNAAAGDRSAVRVDTHRLQLDGDRTAVRAQTVAHALSALLATLARE